MPRPRRQPTPAPAGFWDEVRTHHDQLWADTTDQQVRRFLLVTATDAWRYLDDELQRTGTVWRSNRVLGGMGTISTVNVVKIPADGQRSDGDQPLALNVHYTYVFGRKGAAPEPSFGVRRQMVDAAEAGPPPDSLLLRFAEMRSGLFAPEAEDYQALLAELAIGASGEQRMAPPA